MLVYVPHTTAGLTINEHADPLVARDFEAALERIVAEGWGWQHIEEGEENAPSHIRAALMGPQVVIPLRDGGSRSAPGRASSSASSTGRARVPVLVSVCSARHLKADARDQRGIARVSPMGTFRCGWPPPFSETRSSSSTIDSLAFGGNGVARLDGFVVFCGAACRATPCAPA